MSGRSGGMSGVPFYWPTAERSRGAGECTGTLASSRVPSRTSERIANSPPIACTRSAMLTSPRPPRPLRSAPGSNPSPLSAMASRIASPSLRSVICTALAPECLAAFRTPSWTMR